MMKFKTGNVQEMNITEMNQQRGGIAPAVAFGWLTNAPSLTQSEVS
jgi:hypothetical protein